MRSQAKCNFLIKKISIIEKTMKEKGMGNSVDYLILYCASTSYAGLLLQQT